MGHGRCHSGSLARRAYANKTLFNNSLVGWVVGTFFEMPSAVGLRYVWVLITNGDCAMSTAAPAAPERMEFKTELKQLLDLIIHSLYTKKEIFLRELISNAADAIDKLRFESLTNPDLLQGDTNWKIRLVADEKARTLAVSDNGIGMTREAIVENLGTI